MRRIEERELVDRLVADGLNDCEIARHTGIPRSTVRDWRRGVRGATAAVRQRRRRAHSCAVCLGRDPSPPASKYAYLLGMYLGDGCISAGARTYKLRITLDAGYPGIVAECVAAIRAVRPKNPVRVGQHGPGRCVEVAAHWQHWPCLLPQHGPGRKH
jgi:Homeodomain-like domain